MKYAGMPMGMWMLMKELGLYDLTPALCHLDYTMSEAGGVTDFVRQYGNALEAMSNETVEYVQGIPVVKTFGQSVR